jgi:peptidyl-prolyl cis-trans isomerase D
MLRGIHKASANWLGRAVMGVVMGLLVISFGIWGIGDIFRGFGITTVAKVGDSEIRVEQFRQNYQDRLRQLGQNLGRPILPDQAKAIGFDRQVLSQMVAEAAIDERVDSLRLGLSDAEIARRITQNPNFKGFNGQFDRARFEMYLHNISSSEGRFLNDQRRTALRHQLLNTVSGGISTPKVVLDAFNRFRNEQRAVEYVTLTGAQAGDVPAPTPEVLSKYFEERKVLFRAPEYRKITFVALTAQDLASKIEVPDSDLKKFYEDRRARFETPERRYVKQIVFPNIDEARSAEDKLKGGTTFEALASERGLKETDIDLGVVSKSAVVDRAVADAAFSLKVDQVSAPIEGRFGIAIVKILSVEPSKIQPFEQVAPEIKRELALERAKNEISNVQEKVEDERLGGASLDDAARKFKLNPRVIEADHSGKAPDGSMIADLPKGVDVLSAAFRAEVHGDNEALKLPEGGFVWYDVDRIAASRERPFDEVKDQVATRWRDDQIAARLRTKAGEMVDKVKGGTSFADVAAAYNLKPEWRPGLKRADTPPGLAAAGVTEIFRTPKDVAGSADGAAPTERIVFRVTEVNVPPLDMNSTDAKRLDEALRSRMTDDLLAQYVARLQNDLGVTINQSALNQAVGGSQN